MTTLPEEASMKPIVLVSICILTLSTSAMLWLHLSEDGQRLRAQHAVIRARVETRDAEL